MSLTKSKAKNKVNIQPNTTHDGSISHATKRHRIPPLLGPLKRCTRCSAPYQSAFCQRSGHCSGSHFAVHVLHFCHSTASKKARSPRTGSHSAKFLRHLGRLKLPFAGRKPFAHGFELVNLDCQLHGSSAQSFMLLFDTLPAVECTPTWSGFELSLPSRKDALECSA